MLNFKFLILFLLFPILSYSQVYDKPGNWGLQYKRLKVDTLFTVAPSAYALIGGTTLNTSYKLNVFGNTKLNSLVVDSLGQAPGSGSGGYAVLINRSILSPSFINNSARGYRDFSQLTILNTGAGYASFDATPIIYSDSVHNLDHIVTYQARPIWDYPSGSTLNSFYGFATALSPKTGAVTNLYHFYADHLQATSSPPTVTNQYAFYSPDFSGGITATNNWGVYVAGSTIKNYLQGSLGINDTPSTARLQVDGTAWIKDTTTTAGLINTRFATFYSSSSAGTNTALELRHPTDALGNNVALGFFPRNSASAQARLRAINKGGTSNSFAFDLYTGSALREYMRIDNTTGAIIAGGFDTINAPLSNTKLALAGPISLTAAATADVKAIYQYYGRNDNITSRYHTLSGMVSSTPDSNLLQFEIHNGSGSTGRTTGLVIRGNGNTGLGVYVPTATLHLQAGTATARTAPLKFTSGTNLTTPEAGTVEYDGNNFYATNGTTVRGRVQVNRTTVSSAGTLNLTNQYNHYVFSGTTTTWTLPAVSGNTDVVFYIKNRGSGNITLNSNAGGNDLYTTSAVNTLAIAPGEAYIIWNDGTYFLIEN